MGYFANGTEGSFYEAEYCDRCIHDADDGGCRVWMTHLDWNYEQWKDARKKAILDFLIPRSKDGTGNECCTMFYARELSDGDTKCERCGTAEAVPVHRPYCTAK